MLGRSILVADVIQAIRPDRIGTLSKDDFVTSPFRAIRITSGMEMSAFPAVFDVARARTLYIPNLDAQRLREAPFANIYARKKAASLLSVPWEAGPVNRPSINKDPIYLFSTGRCGSTLLHNILNSA